MANRWPRALGIASRAAAAAARTQATPIPRPPLYPRAAAALMAAMPPPLCYLDHRTRSCRNSRLRCCCRPGLLATTLTLRRRLQAGRGRCQPHRDHWQLQSCHHLLLSPRQELDAPKERPYRGPPVLSGQLRCHRPWPSEASAGLPMLGVAPPAAATAAATVTAASSCLLRRGHCLEKAPAALKALSVEQYASRALPACQQPSRYYPQCPACRHDADLGRPGRAPKSELPVGPFSIVLYSRTAGLRLS